MATVEGQDNSWLTSVGSNHVSMADQSTPRQWIAAICAALLCTSTRGSAVQVLCSEKLWVKRFQLRQPLAARAQVWLLRTAGASQTEPDMLPACAADFISFTITTVGFGALLINLPCRTDSISFTATC